jgi:hypothetical protein
MIIKVKAKLWMLSLLMLAMLLLSISTPVMATATPAAAHPTPVLAYYYIWYDQSSWNRAKTDYPLLGQYSSDDRGVMLQHILWAKAAGIDGFIVSWKSTDTLNRRLDQLADLAEQENFKLFVIYEGLDFQRNPLPASRIASDLDYFIQHFAARPAFHLFNKPVIIWSGTWKFSPTEIAQVTESRRTSLLLLASERNLAGYTRLADLVDGNAYYWSSVNPDTYQGYTDKLIEMSTAVHKHGGLWIPPAASGFDARLVGGTTVVDRKDGQTFRTQINTAMSSSPDALGIISWNEFSENSHIEPSKAYGSKYLDILSAVNQVPSPTIGEFDSSESIATFPSVIPWSRTVALGGLAAVIIAGIIVIFRRKK